MAKGINKVILIGHLGFDPDIRKTTQGNAVANINLATNESWTDKTSGEKKDKTEWHRVVFFGRLAEVVSQYLKKGAQIYIEGRLQTRQWQNKEGQELMTTEIIANEMQMLGSSTSKQPTKTYQQPNGQKKTETEFRDDDIPF